MADTKTYKEGDAYELKYQDAPRPPERWLRLGQQLSIRDADNLLVALWEVEEVDENGAKGKIVRVFRGKAPTDPRRGGPSTGSEQRPAANRRTKPL